IAASIMTVDSQLSLRWLLACLSPFCDRSTAALTWIRMARSTCTPARVQKNAAAALIRIDQNPLRGAANPCVEDFLSSAAGLGQVDSMLAETGRTASVRHTD